MSLESLQADQQVTAFIKATDVTIMTEEGTA